MKEEIENLLKEKCIQVARYAEWISKIMSIKKKIDKSSVCGDYRDINMVTSKDEYGIPLVDQLVVAIMNAIMSFIDGNVGYC